MFLKDERLFLKVVCARVIQKRERNSFEWLWLFMFTAVDKFLSGRWKTDEVDYDDLVKIIDRTLLPKQVISIKNRIDVEKQKTVTIGRFLEILSQLTQVGSDIFKNEEQKLTMLAILTEALLQLTQASKT